VHTLRTALAPPFSAQFSDSVAPEQKNTSWLSQPKIVATWCACVCVCEGGGRRMGGGCVCVCVAPVRVIRVTCVRAFASATFASLPYPCELEGLPKSVILGDVKV
jgi:hypothetical protein